MLSDEAEASSRIEAFANGTSRWMVAVRMVSEGVDVPRLAVGVYATSASTPLFFAQAIGRFVRARRRGETASVFLPQRAAAAGARGRARARSAITRSTATAPATTSGRSMKTLMDAAEREESASDALTTSSRIRRSGRWLTSTACSTTAASSDSSPCRERLRRRSSSDCRDCSNPSTSTSCSSSGRRARADTAGRERPARVPPAEPAPPQALHRTLKEQRQLLNSLVGLYARQTGDPHGMVHAELRRVCGGPAVSHATVAQLQARIDVLRSRVRS